MDVHPPHEPIHSWRDFLLHLATITVGLLIALGLEGAVESLHHRHVVREARENIRRELEQNEKSAQEDLDHVDVNKKSMQTDIDALRRIHNDPAAEKGSHLTYQFDWNSYNHSAWTSARDSGALTYMPTEEVQRYADAYDAQDIAERQAESIFSDEVRIAAPFMVEAEHLSRDEVQQMMRDTAVTYSRLYALHQLIEQLDHEYVEVLKK